MARVPKETPKLSRMAFAVLGIVVAGIVIFEFSGQVAAQTAGKTEKPVIEQSNFPTPDAASKALLAALKNDDDDALIAIFGGAYKKFIVSTDKVGTRADRMKAFRAAQKFLVWQKSGDDKRIMVIGDEAWPMPIPLIKEDGGWRFDTEDGIEEIVNRRIGRNELSAIDVSVAYVSAQKQFASRDRDDDGVREYAQKILSTEGKQDGLYWDSDADPEVSPFGPLVAEAQKYLEGREPKDPFKGYYFRILSRQGEQAPGGRYDYVINGNMIAGFAMVAFPAEYGNSGIMTFIVSHHGDVYQADLGPNTELLGRAKQLFNPDETWTLVKN